MIEQIRKTKKLFETDAADVKDLAQIEDLRIKYLGRKSGILSDLMKGIKDVSAEQRGEFGKEANLLKKFISEKLSELKESLGSKKEKKKSFFDVTLPGVKPLRGNLHPIEIVKREIEDIFLRMGYTIMDGPEVETDWHNFEALNMPPHHPARDMQDTFYLENGYLLRTHTSPVQIRAMERQEPPVRIICPGKTFRVDWDITHTPNFFQVEGLVVDIGVTFADLKGTLDLFCKQLFSEDVVTRFRPSYFPFVEPGAEVDIRCIICGGKGCRTCKKTGWLEIMGAGMVHKKVLHNVGYDSELYTGFAFGMGIGRIAMLKYSINDARLHFENNLRFLQQFDEV